MSRATPPEPVETFIEVGAHKLAVIDGRAGRTGPPVVFLHGIALSAGLWPILLKGTPLDEFSWISLGLPGHFPGEAPDDFRRENVSVRLFAECVVEPVREYFGDRPVHLVGWSTGGFASLAAAARAPAQVASVVSLCGFARGHWGSHAGTMQWLARGWLRERFLVSAMRTVGRSPRLFRWFVNSLARHRRDVPDELWEALFEDYRQHDMQTMCELFAGIRNLDLTPGLAEIPSPVLILGGAADKVIPSSEAHHLHALLPDSRLVEFPGVGHIFFGEALEETFVEICEWIETRR
jgi:pimeloyl-ACP methyl ester carboxylesterase